MDVSPPELRCWLRLARTRAIRAHTLRELVARCGSPSSLFAAAASGHGALGLDAVRRDALRETHAAGVESDLAWLADAGRDLVTLADADYPAPLAACHDAPLRLFVEGRRDLLAVPAVAVVGSRNPSAVGKALARELAAALAAAGVAVISGLAAGIDGAAHAGALAAGGMTVAVAGNGLDRVYPAAHRNLAAAIARDGLLLSEYPPGTAPLARHFPRRNRIISGLSLGVVVVEAAPRSGSLITARLAAEQGREVFAVPGALTNPLAEGCHRLIRDGATLVRHVGDILGELPLDDARAATEGIQRPARCAPGTRDSDLLRALRGGPASIDALVLATGRTAGDVASGLLALELAGHVSSEPGGRYSLLPGSSR